jgi:hypothetical protein
MKAYIFLLFGLITIAFSSCNMTSEANYQPSIEFFAYPLLNGKTSLNVTYSAGVQTLDTIAVGDTVSFYIYLDGYANNLLTYTMTQTSDSVTKILYPSVATLDSIFLPSSNYNKGVFNLKGKSNSLRFPFKYVARKATTEAKIVFSISSDANFEYNQSSFTLKTPIVATKDTSSIN